MPTRKKGEVSKSHKTRNTSILQMSLLIPSECDFEDAHAHPEIEGLYQDLLQEAKTREPTSFRWTFEPVPGFFVQSDPEIDDLAFRYTEQQLGRKATWPELEEKLAALNKAAKPNECYKMVFCARHGQGFHNYVVDKYGMDAWDSTWKGRGTDGDVVYGPDAMLTELGLAQAAENNQVWRREIAEHGAPVPHAFYVSPLQRLCWTLVNTWDGLRGEKKPLVVELLRETIGQNLCDKRSPKLVILERFAPHGFEVEPGFLEEDTLFTDKRELAEEHALRVNRFCQALFEEEWDGQAVNKEKAHAKSIISTTTHAGTIRLFIVVFGHRRFTISTGGMVPIVVKGTRTEV